MELSQHVSVGGHSTKHNLDKAYRATLDHVEQGLIAENVTLRRASLKKVYDELFGDAVKAYNDKQKRSDRKIEDYYEKVRDDARGHKGVQNKEGKRLAYEQVVGIGNRETFHASNPANVELAKKVYGDYVTEFEKRFPQLRVFEAVIHVDEVEGGIHLHNAYVPWGEGYKKGMSRQQSLSKACENMGFDHKELDTRSKQLLEEVCLKHGIERLDMGNTEHHKPTPQYKREQRELELIREQKEQARAAHFKQQKVLSAKRNTVERSVGRLAAQETSLKRTTVNLMTQKKAVTAELIEVREQVREEAALLIDVKNATKAAEADLATKNDELVTVSQQVSELSSTADRLRDEVIFYAEKAGEYNQEAERARKETEALKREIGGLERTRDDLKAEISSLKEEKGVLQKAVEALEEKVRSFVKLITPYLPNPLLALARFFRDGDEYAREDWHDDMDYLAEMLSVELPTRAEEEWERTIAGAVAASQEAYERNDHNAARDEWNR